MGPKHMGAGPYLVLSVVRLLLDALASVCSLFIWRQASRVTHIEPHDAILSRPASVLARAIKSGELKSEQVVERFIAQIERVNPVINAVVAKHYDGALSRAREIDSLIEQARTSPEARKRHKRLLESPLLGVPFTCKESIALEGAPYTAGLHLRRHIRASASSPAVERLVRQGGLVPLASTNTPAMNAWYDSYNLLYGRTLNPYDLARIPGGSSGGEAAILAASGSCLGVGSDLAGSIRMPAHFCGVFGHKPTPCAISLRGLYPAHTCPELGSAGPMARFACDLKPALELMITDEQARARMRLDEPVDLRSLRVFYCEQLGDPLASRCDAHVRQALAAVLKHLKSSLAIEAHEVQLDGFAQGMRLWKAELQGKLQYAPEHEDGLVAFNPLLELIRSFVGRSQVPFNAIALMLLDKLTDFALNSEEHARALAHAAELRAQFNELVGADGLLIMPTFPQAAPEHALSLLKFTNIAYAGAVNVLHAPVTQCPVGRTSAGLPVGLQLVAAPHNDRLTLALACELDKAFGGWRPVD